MKPYKLILNGKSRLIHAESWWQVFKLAMAGLKHPPAGLVITPVKQKQPETDLPIMLKYQAH